MFGRKKEWGFSLLELLVVLTIGATLAAIAVPSFQGSIKRNGIKTHIHDLSATLKLARSEAVERGEAVAICGSSDLTSCNNSFNWSAGWIAFVDDGSGTGGSAGDNNRNGSEEIVKTYRYTGNNSLIVKDAGGNGLNAVSFNSRGFVLQNIAATLRVCEDSGDTGYARALLLEKTGRVVVSYDLYDSGGNNGADGIYEDVNGNNLTCT